MQFKLNSFLVLIPILLFIGCKTDKKSEPIFFGGQIKNPKTSTVFIFKGDKEIAKASLSRENEFEFKLDSLKTGLYTFKHGKEYQYFFIEPKDSLLIRLNTWDFDESLVFTGKGAERNNFLLQLFLENEREEKLFFNYFGLDETAFISKADSLLQLKKLLFKQFKAGTSRQSSLFSDLIKMAINFPIYSNKEKYALQYKHKNNLKSLPKLSDSFYSFRDKEILKKTDFNNYYLFENYLWYSVYNKALHKKELDDTYQLSTFLLKEISKNVSDKKIQNTMLQQVFISSLLDESCGNHDKKLAKQLFFDHCTDDDCIKEVKDLLSVVETLKKGSEFPKLIVQNIKGKSVELSRAFTKGTVLYFWPKELSRIENMSKRVLYLTAKFPNIRFIGIDAQLDKRDWREYVHKNKFPERNQFRISKAKNSYFTNGIPRAVLIDKKGIIKSDYTYLTQKSFEDKLAILENNN